MQIQIVMQGLKSAMWNFVVEQGSLMMTVFFGDLHQAPVDAKHNGHPACVLVYSTFSMKMVFSSVHIWSVDLFLVKDNAPVRKKEINRPRMFDFHLSGNVDLFDPRCISHDLHGGIFSQLITGADEIQALQMEFCNFNLLALEYPIGHKWQIPTSNSDTGCRLQGILSDYSFLYDTVNPLDCGYLGEDLF